MRLLLTFAIGALGVAVLGLVLALVSRGRRLAGNCGALAGTRTEDGGIKCGVCTKPSESCKWARSARKRAG